MGKKAKQKSNQSSFATAVEKVRNIWRSREEQRKLHLRPSEKGVGRFSFGRKTAKRKTKNNCFSLIYTPSGSDSSKTIRIHKSIPFITIGLVVFLAVFTLSMKSGVAKYESKVAESSNAVTQLDELNKTQRSKIDDLSKSAEQLEQQLKTNKQKLNEIQKSMISNK